jgi:hypothetical protein
MSKSCPNDKIYNPQSKRCVSVDGKKAKEIWTAYSKGEIVLQQEDILKMMAFLDKKPGKMIITKANEKGKSPVVPVKVSSFVQKRLKNNLGKIKEQNNIYINYHHQSACEKNDLNQIGPIITQDISVNVPYTSFKCLEHLHKQNLQEMLQNKDVKTETAIHKCLINYSFNNFNRLREFQTNPKIKAEYKNNPNQFFQDNFDEDWFVAQHKYIRSLTFEEFLTVHGYTMHGDVVINMYLRKANWWSQLLFYLQNNHSYLHRIYMPFGVQAIRYIEQNNTEKITDTPDVKADSSHHTIDSLIKGIKMPKSELVGKYNSFVYMSKYIKKSAWAAILDMYVEDLNKIIKKAPPLNKNMVVFRGVKDDYYLTGRDGFTYENNGFLSTSLSAVVAKRFMNGSPCCFKKITLLKGLRVLLMMGLSKFPDEMELLLPTGALYSLRRTYKMPQETVKPKTSHMKPQDIKKTVCPGSKTPSKIKMTEVIILK